MSTFNLLHNPFAILGVCPSDDAETVEERYEYALSEHKVDEKTILKAHQTLMAIKPRLHAELSWLLGVAPGRLDKIITMLHQGNEAEAAETLPSLPPLARMNLAVHLCAHGQADASYVKSALSAKADVQSGLVAALINGERQIAGIRPISEELVESGLRDLERHHVEAIVAAITADTDPSMTMTDVVGTFIDAPAGARDMLECIVDGFDRWTAPQLHAIDEAVDVLVERLQSKPQDDGLLETIETLLNDWYSLSQAQQLIYQSKSLDEPRSKNLYSKLRDIAISLANERHLYAISLRIMLALQRTFTGLYSVREQVPEDLQTLRELLAAFEEANRLRPLLTAIEAAMESPSAFVQAVRSGALSASDNGQAGAVWKAFGDSVETCLDTEHEDAPWLAMRQLAIQLHNDHDSTAAALRISIMLLAHQPPPPDSVREMLAEDRLLLELNLVRADLGIALEAKNHQRILALAQRLLDLTDDGDEREKLRTLCAIAREHLSRRRRKLWRFAVAAGLAVMFLLVRSGYFSNHVDSTPTMPSTSVTSSSPAERKPARTGIHLQLEELRYCMYEDQRLEGARPAVDTEARKSGFNALIADYNMRCSEYTYSAQDMAVVKSELRTGQPKLREDGAEMMRAISGGSPPTRDAGTRPAAQPAGPLESGSVLLTLSRREDASRVQNRLAELKLYSRAIDGRWGPASQSALDIFIVGQGLPKETGWNLNIQRRLFSGTGQ